MGDLHVRQGVGTTCPGRNCAAASAAMAIAAATDGRVKLTADDVRRQSGRSCEKKSEAAKRGLKGAALGKFTNSGGLLTGDVKRVGQASGVGIDYGPGNVRVWPPAELRSRLRSGFGAVILGDYEKAPIRITKTFLGDHSAWVHGIRTTNGVEECHWHDPLATVAVWVPVEKVEAYNRFKGKETASAVAGLAGFVRVAAAGADAAEEEEDEMPELILTKVGPFSADIAKGKQLFSLAGKPLIVVSVPQMNRLAPFETQVGGTTFLAVELTTGGKRQLVLVKPGDATVRPFGAG